MCVKILTPTHRECHLCGLCHFHCFQVDTLKALQTKATYYNNLPSNSIPTEGEKVKEFYQCKRKCINCGFTGVTSHQKGNVAEDAVKCPNCKTLDNFVKG